MWSNSLEQRLIKPQPHTWVASSLLFSPQRPRGWEEEREGKWHQRGNDLTYTVLRFALTSQDCFKTHIFLLLIFTYLTLELLHLTHFLYNLRTVVSFLFLFPPLFLSVFSFPMFSLHPCLSLSAKLWPRSKPDPTQQWLSTVSYLKGTEGILKALSLIELEAFNQHLWWFILLSDWCVWSILSITC